MTTEEMDTFEALLRVFPTMPITYIVFQFKWGRILSNTPMLPAQ